MSPTGPLDDSAKRALILVVLPSVPWPARRSGFALRYFPLLRYLCSRHQVELLLLGDREGWDDLGPLAEWCPITKVDVGGAPRTPWQRMYTIVRGIYPRSAPYALRSAWTSHIVDAVDRISKKKAYDVLLWAGPAFLEAAVEVAQLRPAKRCVFDLIDSPTLLERHAKAQSGRDESEQFARWEARLQRTADLTIYISDADARGTAQQGLANKIVIPNGLFLDDLAASAERSPLGSTNPYVLFFGQMSYYPNVDAAQRLALEIMPLIRERIPDAGLVLMGHQPAQEVTRLQDAHTIVTGSVPSIWPYVRGAAACVFPLRLGTGLQNKILEALVVGAPVVTTSQCAARLAGAIPGEHLLVADTSEEIARATLGVLQDRTLATRIGRNGQLFVRKSYDWTSLCETFERVLLSIN